jgi:hypothetical protein
MLKLECVYFIEESDQEIFDNALVWHHAHHPIDPSNTTTSQAGLNLQRGGGG